MQPVALATRQAADLLRLISALEIVPAAQANRQLHLLSKQLAVRINERI